MPQVQLTQIRFNELLGSKRLDPHTGQLEYTPLLGANLRPIISETLGSWASS